MKIKAVEVFDVGGTDMWVWVGKMSEEDQRIMNRTGWGPNATLIVKPNAHGPTEVVLSELWCPEVDLGERGNMNLNRTTYLLAVAVRNIPFEEVKDIYDFRSEKVVVL